jgi:hypothetical protein
MSEIDRGSPMPAELPIHLKQLEPLTGALDMLRYLVNRSADGDELADELGLSDRAFDKAKRRLVTNGYVATRSDGIMELTQKGINAAEDLAEYEANAPADRGTEGRIARRVLVAMPRTLTAGQPTPVLVGFEADATGKFKHTSDVVLRFSAINAELSDKNDQRLALSGGAAKHTVEITPSNYDQVRLKMQVFQISPDGVDISDCGGLYVDVNVQSNGQPGNLVAYSAKLEFQSQ